MSDSTPETTSEWNSSLPDELKNHGSLQNYSDVSGLARAYIELERKMGSAPSSVDTYEIPEGADDQTRAALEACKSGALENKVSKGGWDKITESIVDSRNSAQRSLTEQLTALQDGFDAEAKAKYGDKLAEVKATAADMRQKLFGGDETVTQFLEASGLQDHPAMLRLFEEVAGSFGGDHIPAAIGGAATELSTPVEGIKSKIRALRADEAYLDRSHPRHEEVKAQFLALYGQLGELGVHSVRG